MNRLAYNVLFTLILPLIVLRLLWRAVRAPAYARRWRERFGMPVLSREQQARKGQWLWLHAVSVGETLAAAPLVRKLLADHPEMPIVITTMTPTGSERVQALFGDSVCHVYAPYDHPWIVNAFLRRFRPHTVVIMETELWPNIVHCSKAAGATVIVANARLSEKSFRGYEKFAKLGKPMLQAIDCIAAQAEADAQRFERLGVARERLAVTGSIKFEIDLPEDLEAKRQAMRASFESSRPVLIAASTREGEEEHVLQAFTRCLQEMPNLLLILVPRHPERFKAVARQCQQMGLQVVKRSEQIAVSEQTQVFLGDSMGEMLTYFSVSDVAFVGGSLVNTGCHNVLEPAALGLPVLVGPSQYNFQSICEQLEAAGALKTVPDANGLAQAVLQVFADESLRHNMGVAGRRLIEENRGALARIETIVWQACQTAFGKGVQGE